MPAIHIRNVPESTLAALRERAEYHGRSMQQEVLEILNSAAVPAPRAVPSPIRLVTAHTAGTATWRREDIYDDEDR